MSTPDTAAWFGRYRLTSRVATGGMAEVFVGRHISEDGRFGPMVAVKRLLPHLARDTQVVQMFLNEARITAQIDHPNVVRIVDLGHERGEPYIAMELLEGHSFAELRQKAAEEGRRVPLGVTLKVLAEACRGLDAAHRAVDEQGKLLAIVHRDFTPDNIHVGVNGDVKVIDFGIAKTHQWGSNTEPGVLKGKFFYMSPEMIAGREVDHRADLFAAGVMLYEQLCGRRPFTGLTTHEVVARIAEGRPRPPSEFDPSVPLDLERICLTALSRDPEQRFPSLLEFVQAIEAVGGEARVASRGEVGSYVSELFPAERDPRRQTLRRARQQDPSLPGVATKAEAEPVPMTELEAPAVAAPLPVVRSPPSRRLWMAIGLVLGLSLAAAAVMLLRPSEKTPAERLKAAEATREAKARTELLSPLGTQPSATANDLARAGALLLASEADDAALDLSEAFAVRFPNDGRAALLEAKAATRLRLGKRAQTALERASTTMPDSHEPDLLLADLRERQGDSGAALEALDRAAKKRSGRLEVAARRGYLLSQAGRLDEAAEALELALSRRFDAVSAAELAFVRFRQLQTDEAAALLRRALKKDPSLPQAHYYLGAVLFRQGDRRGAIRAYREADRLNPSDPRSLVALCQLQAQTRSAEADETRALLTARFGDRAPGLLSSCHPEVR